MQSRGAMGVAALVVLIGLAAGLAGCPQGSASTGACTTNAECPPGAYCKPDGNCACKTDEACMTGEVCNSQGICQKREACRDDADCPADVFCDLASGACIPRTACGADVHCPPGTVCDVARHQCADGCHDDGDCPLYSICDRSRAGSSTTALGACLRGRCDDNAFCAYGSRCTGKGGTCQPDPDPNCAACSNRPGDCGDARNYCLVNADYNASNPRSGTQFFCGVTCRPDANDCPSGYACGPVSLLTQNLCANDPACGGMGRTCEKAEGSARGFCTCATDADCATDHYPPICTGTCGGLGLRLCLMDSDCQALTCDKSHKVCQWPEGRSCNQDMDCEALPLCASVAGTMVCVDDTSTPPRSCASSDDCQCVANKCVGSGRPCAQSSDCKLHCKDGGCLVGYSCGPLAGLHCPDVRP